jgi:hypothetical protein
MATFADQVYDGPVLLSLLQVFHRQVNQFRPSQTTTEQQCQHRKVSLAPDRASGRNVEKRLSLLRSKPVSDPDSELFWTLNSANAGGKLWAEQTAISRFVRQAANRGKTYIDRGCGQVASFEL